MTPSTSNLTTICICGKPNCDIPFGLCHCRCGQKTRCYPMEGVMVALKGRPQQFINGHQRKVRLPLTDEPPFYIDGDPCRKIPLSQSQFAIVDADNYEWLMQWKWTLKKGRNTYYAYRLDYRNGSKNPIQFSLHRVVCVPPAGDKEVDHENGNGLDNRRHNLRPAEPWQQRQNMGVRSNSTSGYPGVHLDKRCNKWASRIKVRGVDIWLGRHTLLDEAIRVRKEAEKKYFGEFARYK